MWTFTFVLLLFSVVIGDYIPKQNPIFESILSIESPIDNFDISEKWPQCKDVFEDIQAEGNCSSSYAISTVTSIRDRRCIKSGVKDPISAYDLISCCSDCQLDGKNGCNGGDHHSAFQYFLDSGIVTGGAYHSNKGCKPYLINPNKSSPKPTSTKCDSTCQSSYTKKDYQHDKIKGVDLLVLSNHTQLIMDEIIKNGPLVVEFNLFTDFLNYSSGIYERKTGKLIGYYYAKILGWEKDKSSGINYWKAAASFGPNWGENGTFRIKRGSNECNFESNVIGAIVGNSPEQTTTVAPKPMDLNSEQITAYYVGKFQDPSERLWTINVQFQITLDINLQEKIIQLKIDNYNQSDFGFTLFSDIFSVECKPSQKEDCTVKFNHLTSLLLSIWPTKSLFTLDFLYIYPLINTEFTIEKAIGNCGLTLKNNNLKELDSSLYKSCFCSGDKYKPHSSLRCPKSPWS